MIKLPRNLHKVAFNVLKRTPSMLLVNLLITRNCTQKCLQCSIHESIDDKGSMSYEDFVLLTDRVYNHGTQFLNLSGGEPLLNKQLGFFLKYAASKGFLFTQLLTNLYASDKIVENAIEVILETATGIQISFDGFGEVADKLRGAKNVSDKVIKGIKILDRENRKINNPVRTSLNVVISKYNMRQVPEILDFVESLGWKVTFDLYRWSSVSHLENEELKVFWSDELIKVLALIRNSHFVTTPRVIIDGYSDFLQGNFQKRCPYLDAPSLGAKFMIESNGDVRTCIGDPVGNLINQTPDEIFKSPPWLYNRKEMEACAGCWNSCYTPSAVTFNPKSIKDIKAIWSMYQSR